MYDEPLEAARRRIDAGEGRVPYSDWELQMTDTRNPLGPTLCVDMGVGGGRRGKELVGSWRCDPRGPTHPLGRALLGITHAHRSCRRFYYNHRTTRRILFVKLSLQDCEAIVNDNYVARKVTEALRTVRGRAEQPGDRRAVVAAEF